MQIQIDSENVFLQNQHHNNFLDTTPTSSSQSKKSNQNSSNTHEPLSHNIESSPISKKDYLSELSETIEQDEDDDLDLDQIEQLLKRQDTPEFKKAQQREHEYIQAVQSDLIDNINIINVPIRAQINGEKGSKINNNSVEWVHTLECGNTEGDILLMLHGYGQTSLSFLQSVQILQQKFKIYIIDLPGMGLSSRFSFNYEDPNQMINFMIECIESWRKQMNIETEMTIIGHCIGAYIANFYAFKYQKYVKQLQLINPLGVTQFTESQLHDIQQNLEKKQGYFGKKCLKWAQNMYQQNQSLSTLSKKFYIPSNYLIKKFFHQTVCQDKNIAAKYQKYMKRVLQFQPSTEQILTHLFKLPNLAAKIPLELEYSKYCFKQNQQSKRQSIFSNSSAASLNLKEVNISKFGENKLHPNQQDDNNYLYSSKMSIQSQQSHHSINSERSKLSSNNNSAQKKQQQNNDPSTQRSNSNSDVILQTISNKSTLSQINHCKKQPSQDCILNFKVNFIYSQKDTLIVNKDGCKKILKKFPCHTRFDQFQGEYQSILQNTEIYEHILKSTVQ